MEGKKAPPAPIAVLDSSDMPGHGSVTPRVGALSKRADLPCTPITLLHNLTHARLRMKKLVLVMVGLPARGKSYVAVKLQRYLNWNGFRTKIFNAGATRRKLLGPCTDSTFFDPSNAQAALAREEIAYTTLKLLLKWLDNDEGDVGIFDATNTTRARRACVMERVADHPSIHVVFVECVCDDEDILKENYRVKLGNADYRNMDPAEALADFARRVARYEAVYESVEEDELSFIKIINVGRRVVINRCQGYLMTEVASCLSNLHITKRSIYLARHGESEDNAKGLLGGDSPLTPSGHSFARALGEFMFAEGLPSLLVWTSTLVRSRQTVVPITECMTVGVYSTPLLNEIDGGLTEGMTYAEVEAKHPELFEARCRDKLHFRMPGGGESYLDVVERLRPLILELERLETPVLVVSHQAVTRTILSYWTDVPQEDMPHLQIPLHSIIKLTPAMYGYAMDMYQGVEVPGADGTPSMVFEKRGDVTPSTSTPKTAADAADAAAVPTAKAAKPPAAV